MQEPPEHVSPENEASPTEVAPKGRHPWLTGKAIWLHVFMIVVAVGCVLLGWWQLKRGEAGNLRSYAYALEWPFFAGAAIYMWFRTLREDITAARNAAAGIVPDPEPEDLPEFSSPAARQAALDRIAEDDPDPELDAYNGYLASLNQPATK